MNQKLLMIKPGALGDTILIFDTLKNLKYHHYDVTFVGNADYVTLIDYFDLGKGISIDNPIFLPLFYDNISIQSKKLDRLLQFLDSFPLVFYYAKHKDELFYKLKQLKHQSIYFISSIPHVPISVRFHLLKNTLEKLNLKIHFKDAFMVHTPQNKTLVIHPGAGSIQKRWDIRNFMDLIQFLKKSFEYIILVYGPAEQDIPFLLQDYKHEISLHLITSLKDFIQMIQKSFFYIGNDSGITHLASYIGIRGIAIFGRTDPILWHPYPCLHCLYEVNHDGIEFPSLDFVKLYLQFIQL